MITTIISLILKLIGFLIKSVISLVMIAFPNLNLQRVTLAFTGFYGLVGNAMQLTYFLFGPMTYIFADIIITLWITKHLVLPIVNFTRKVLIK